MTTTANVNIERSTISEIENTDDTIGLIVADGDINISNTYIGNNSTKATLIDAVGEIKISTTSIVENDMKEAVIISAGTEKVTIENTKITENKLGTIVETAGDVEIKVTEIKKNETTTEMISIVEELRFSGKNSIEENKVDTNNADVDIISAKNIYVKSTTSIVNNKVEVEGIAFVGASEKIVVEDKSTLDITGNELTRHYTEIQSIIYSVDGYEISIKDNRK